MIGLLFFLAAAQTPLRGDAALDDIQHRAVKFFWEQSNPDTGYTKDRATNFDPNDTHTVASCASIGFAFVAYAIGTQRHWLDRKPAYDRTLLTLQKLNTSYPNEHGWLYHFIDWKTGERVWNCEASSIDTSICLAGIIDAERYWKDPKITAEAQKFEKRIDWNWMLTNDGTQPNQVFLCMGWRPEEKFLNSRWSGYDELPMLYVQAYGFNPQMTNQGWDKVQRDIVTDRGHTFLVGGPLFMHEMSLGFYDFSNKRDRQGFNYRVSSTQAALANRAYCIDNPGKFKGYGPDFWGLSACDTPEGYQAMGTPEWVRDDGTITPTSAIAAVPYTTKESLSTLASLLKNHADAYGRYGFSNGICPNANWNDPDVIGIDLGMMLLGVEDYRTGLPWKLSMSSPVIKQGFRRAGLHDAPGSDAGPLQQK